MYPIKNIHIDELTDTVGFIDKFTQSYLYTASWVTCDSGENTDFTKNAIKIATEDCRQFINRVIKEYGVIKGLAILTIKGNDLDYLTPHNFFLTRNRHGAGFWDSERIYGVEEAKALTEISHSMGEADCYHVGGRKSRKLTF
jgi:hypothetical protein